MTTAYEGPARVELMGHRQRVGRVSEAEVYGGKMLRVDIPIPGGGYITEYYGVGSIYALTPISEDVLATYVERNSDPRPVRPVDFRIEAQPTYDDEPS